MGWQKKRHRGGQGGGGEKEATKKLTRKRIGVVGRERKTMVFKRAAKKRKPKRKSFSRGKRLALTGEIDGKSGLRKKQGRKLNWKAARVKRDLELEEKEREWQCWKKKTKLVFRGGKMGSKPFTAEKKEDGA